MKIFLSALIAVLFVSASAFVNLKGQKENVTTEYFFYEVVGGQVDTDAPLNDEPMTIEEFNEFNPIGCSTGNNADCIRAWEVGNTPSTILPGDYTIRKL